MRERMREDAMPIDDFVKSACKRVMRVPGTAIFMSATPDGVPAALLYNMKHNKVLHERIVILTVKVEGVPHVDEDMRAKVTAVGDGFYRIVLRYGFMQEMDVPAALELADNCGGPFKKTETSYLLGRQTVIPSARPGMAIWREKLFAWMLGNAEGAMEFFKLPTNRFVELGSQLEI